MLDLAFGVDEDYRTLYGYMIQASTAQIMIILLKYLQNIFHRCPVLQSSQGPFLGKG
jgi:hypothetical protein